MVIVVVDDERVNIIYWREYAKGYVHSTSPAIDDEFHHNPGCIQCEFTAMRLEFLAHSSMYTQHFSCFNLRNCSQENMQNGIS